MARRAPINGAGAVARDITCGVVAGSRSWALGKPEAPLHGDADGKHRHHRVLHRQSAPQNATAERLALTTLLRRKGRVLDAVSGTLQTLRDRLSPDDRLVLDKLSATRGQLSTLALRGPACREDASQVELDDVGGLSLKSDRVVPMNLRAYLSISPQLSGLRRRRHFMAPVRARAGNGRYGLVVEGGNQAKRSSSSGRFSGGAVALRHCPTSASSSD